MAVRPCAERQRVWPSLRSAHCRSALDQTPCAAESSRPRMSLWERLHHRPRPGRGDDRIRRASRSVERLENLCLSGRQPSARGFCGPRRSRRHAKRESRAPQGSPTRHGASAHTPGCVCSLQRRPRAHSLRSCFRPTRATHRRHAARLLRSQRGSDLTAEPGVPRDSYRTN
jgi:hypothetical protein